MKTSLYGLIPGLYVRVVDGRPRGLTPLGLETTFDRLCVCARRALARNPGDVLAQYLSDYCRREAPGPWLVVQ